MVIRQGDGESDIIIPKSLLVTLMLASWAAIGSGGYYMGIQFERSTNMKESIIVLTTEKDANAAAVASITRQLDLLQSTTKYGIALTRAKP